MFVGALTTVKTANLAPWAGALTSGSARAGGFRPDPASPHPALPPPLALARPAHREADTRLVPEALSSGLRGHQSSTSAKVWAT